MHIHAGTWGKFKPSSTAIAMQGCFYQMDSSATYKTTGYLCACSAAATSHTWRSVSLCTTAATAAATSPAICRYQQVGGTNWALGWVSGSTCLSGAFPYGNRGAWIKQAPAGSTVQALCKETGKANSCQHVTEGSLKERKAENMNNIVLCNLLQTNTPWRMDLTILLETLLARPSPLQLHVANPARTIHVAREFTFCTRL